MEEGDYKFQSLMMHEKGPCTVDSTSRNLDRWNTM